MATDLAYELTASDYEAFWAYHFEHRQASQRTVARQRVVFPVLYLLIGLPDAIHGRWSFFVMMAIIALGWFLLLPRYYGWSVRRNARRVAQEGLCRGSVGPQRLQLGADGVRVSNSYFETNTRWAGVVRLVETTSHLFLYLGANAAHTLPKRAFDAAQLEILRSTITQHLGEAAA